MKLTGENRINASPEEVWHALNDPDILKQAIPGCDTLEKISDTQFKATVTTKIGPVQAKFTGEVELTDLDPPKGYTISGKGSGGVAGNARGGAKVRLEPDGNGTKLFYDVDAQVTGKLAQLGSRLIDSTAKMLAGQFFNKFEALVSKPEAPAAAPTVAATATAAAATATAAAAGQSTAARPAVPSGQDQKAKGIPAWFWAVAISLFIVLFSYYFKK
jgi:carbon monoxide dehydrogenase subunit G